MGVEHDLNNIALQNIAHRVWLLQQKMADLLKT
jgi:hypothetical protein